MALIPSSANNPTLGECERYASGSAGVPPAVRCDPHHTRRTATGDRISLGVRVYSAGRAIRQAGRPRYPRHAVLLSVRLFVKDGTIPYFENNQTFGGCFLSRRDSQKLAGGGARNEREPPDHAKRVLRPGGALDSCVAALPSPLRGLSPFCFTPVVPAPTSVASLRSPLRGCLRQAISPSARFTTGYFPAIPPG